MTKKLNTYKLFINLGYTIYIKCVYRCKRERKSKKALRCYLKKNRRLYTQLFKISRILFSSFFTIFCYDFHSFKFQMSNFVQVSVCSVFFKLSSNEFILDLLFYSVFLLQ